jgi:type VI secretion system protein ImpK
MPTRREDLGKGDWESSTGRSKTLADLCSDAFLLIFHIRAGNDPGHPEDLRKSIAQLLQNFDRQAGRAGHSEEDIKAARYALCALIDETVLNSRWAFKDQWADRPLQLEHFGEHMAGERFFDLLERIRQKGKRKADLLEVFCICLVLGFQGKYKLRGREELAKMLHTLVEEAGSYRDALSGLSPHWKIPDEPAEKPPSTIPKWALITAIAAVAAVVVAFVVFKFWLVSAADEAVRRMIL